MEGPVVPAGREGGAAALTAGWALALGLLGFVATFELTDESGWAAAPPLAALVLVLLGWVIRRRRHGPLPVAGPPRRFPSRRVAWLVVLAAGLAANAGGLGLVGAASIGRTTTVRVDYEALVTPEQPGGYEVIIPATTRPEDVTVTSGEASVERVATEHGEGWRIVAEGSVGLRASTKDLIRAEEFGAYHPTLTTSTQPNPARDGDKEYWIFVGAQDPVRVTLRMDVGDGCGTYENRLNATANPGWGTYRGTWAYPHGDLCASGTELLLLLVGWAFVLMAWLLAPLGVVFLLGLVGLSVDEAWWQLRRGREGERPDI